MRFPIDVSNRSVLIDLEKIIKKKKKIQIRLN